MSRRPGNADKGLVSASLTGIMNDMYRATTHDIEVTVQPIYLDEQSMPEKGLYVWAYWIQIRNHSNRSVQLKRRHWQITDAAGKLQEVSGDGVVGEQPVIAAGGLYEYTSGTPLGTPSGIMVGRYEMQDESGAVFEIDVPAFSLDSPHQQMVHH